MNIYPVDLNTS